MRNIDFLKIFALLCLLACVTNAFAHQGSATYKPYDLGRFEAARADSLTGFDVQKYELTLDIDHQEEYIDGNVLAMVLAEEDLSSLPYELADNFAVSFVLVDGAPAAFTHSGGILDISLDVQTGETFTTQVFYSGYPQLSPNIYHIGMIFSANTVFTISDPDAARYWWPCYDHPWDKALVDLHITLRDDWSVAANGIRDSIVDNGDGTATTHWLGENPMTTYLVCITAGPYVEINQTAGDIPIQSFVMPNQYDNALVDFANVPAMIGYFSQVFGPYPFEKYGHAAVSMSTYGAMEHQTMTTLGNYIITGNGTYETVIAHELAHQWYGNAVSFLTFKDVWLSEGFATYSEHLWTDKTQGWQAAVDYVNMSYHQYYIGWAAGAGPQTIYDPDFNSYFAPPSYEKAASVLHMLRLKIGNAAFSQLLQDWFTAYRDSNAVTSEFKALAEQISGQDLDQFFQQWIFGSGMPELEYSIWNNPASDSPLKIIAKTISNTSTQFHIEVPFLFEHGGEVDSLLIEASPGGQNNHAWPEYTPVCTLTPNHNHWTLLRGITQKQPVLSECLPSNACVLLSWESFYDDPTLSYNVYRKAVGETDWTLLNPQPLNALEYTDDTPQNGTEYEYAVAAVDPGGWKSTCSNILTAEPLAFSFENDLLVVDETRDGNGANINPDDAMVDNFYDVALDPLVYAEWDVADQGLPPLDVLGQYRLVLWHADDFSQNLLMDHLNTLGGYLLGGGKVILSGWKTPSVFSDPFLQRFFGGAQLLYDNSACLISAQSAEYTELEVDPAKTISIWDEMLPYIYTFPGAQNPVYTATLDPGAQGNGNCVAFKQEFAGSGSEFLLFGFPLYFMQSAGVRGFLQEIIPEMLSPVTSDDPSLPALEPALGIFPNPFRTSSRVSFSLPGKGLVSLKVYNARGQLVRELMADEKDAGLHETAFDARDKEGNPLPSGIYILRMEHAGKSLTRKFSLVK